MHEPYSYSHINKEPTFNLTRMKKTFTLVIIVIAIPLVSFAQNGLGCNSSSTLISLNYGYGVHSPFNIRLSTSFYNGVNRFVPGVFISAGSHKNVFNYPEMKIVYGGTMGYRLNVNENNVILPAVGIAGLHDRKVTNRKQSPYTTEAMNKLLPVIEISYNHLLSKDNVQSQLVYLFTGIEYTDEAQFNIGLRFVF